ncbi:MAG TPA: DUF1003 domain-containing protein [Caulobacteraceae bacterium]|jgi:uncharacterized membrane protein
MSEQHPGLLHPLAALRELRARHRPPRNTHVHVMDNLTPLTKVAVWITARVGTMAFFLVILSWTLGWLGWNFLAPERLRFDPPMGFVFYLFMSNVIQLLLMPLIMVGQNIQGSHSEARAEHDLEINVKAEQEIEVILHRLEEQNQILTQMVRKLDIDVRDSIAQLGGG